MRAYNIIAINFNLYTKKIFKMQVHMNIYTYRTKNKHVSKHTHIRNMYLCYTLVVACLHSFIRM